MHFLHKKPTFKLQCKSNQEQGEQIYIIGVRGLKQKQKETRNGWK